MISVSHLCDLGPHGVLRVLNSEPHRLLVETTARRALRIAAITIDNGRVNFLRTSAPLLSKSDESFAGERWACKKNRRHENGTRSSTITWQDSPGEETFAVDFPDEECVSICCPRNGKRLFSGTRQNAETGDGTLTCLEEGRVVWAYHPTDIARLPPPMLGFSAKITTNKSQGTDVGPSLPSLPPSRLIRAYPYRIVCSQQMQVAFSFLNTLYVLDSAGTLIQKWGMATLLHEVCDADFSSPSSLTSLSEIGDVTIRTSIIGPQMEPPRVSALVVSDDGNVFAAAARTMMLWITPDAKIAHACEVPIGKRNGFGDSGQITRIELLGNGGTAVVEVCGTGFVTIEGGKVRGVLETDMRDKVWDVSRKDCVVAIASRQKPTIEFFDSELRSLGTAPIRSPATSMQFSDDGRFLFTQGDCAAIYNANR